MPRTEEKRDDTKKSSENDRKRKRRSGWDNPNPSGTLTLSTPQATGILENQAIVQSLSADIGKIKTEIPTMFALNQPTLHAIRPMLANRIYVGSLQYDLKEREIRAIFSPFGCITGVDMSFEPSSGKSKGFCFIEYDDPLAAESAVQVMNGYTVSGRGIKVGRPQGAITPPGQLTIGQQAIQHIRTNRLYVGGVVVGITSEQIQSVFAAFGVIKSCIMVPSQEDLTVHRGFGFLEYESIQCAEDAIKHMNALELAGEALKVGKASPSAFGSGPKIDANEAIERAQAAARAAAARAGIVTNDSSSTMSKPCTLASEENITISSHNRLELMQKLSRESLPSRCILLLNLVDPLQVDDDLGGEVKEECENYGKVEKVKIVEKKDLVEVYVIYVKEESATKAIAKLHNRFFGGRKITAEYYDLKQFFNKFTSRS